jgi:hypothetical protein
MIDAVTACLFIVPTGVCMTMLRPDRSEFLRSLGENIPPGEYEETYHTTTTDAGVAVQNQLNRPPTSPGRSSVSTYRTLHVRGIKSLLLEKIRL